VGNIENVILQRRGPAIRCETGRKREIERERESARARARERAALVTDIVLQFFSTRPIGNGEAR